MAAAEAIIRSRRFQALDKFSRDEAELFLGVQGEAMATGFRSIEERDEADGESTPNVDEETDIRWDAAREEFVVREK